jgi:hypothetical protein
MKKFTAMKQLLLGVKEKAYCHQKFCALSVVWRCDGLQRQELMDIFGSAEKWFLGDVILKGFRFAMVPSLQKARYQSRQSSVYCMNGHVKQKSKKLLFSVALMKKQPANGTSCSEG